MKRLDWFVTRIVLAGCGLAALLLLYRESGPLSKSAIQSFISADRPVASENAGLNTPPKPRREGEAPPPLALETPPVGPTTITIPTTKPSAIDPRAPVASSAVTVANAHSRSNSIAPMPASEQPIQVKTQPKKNKNRSALVIGISNYRDIPQLRNAAADATAVANMLRALGFKVTLERNIATKEVSDTVTLWLSTLDHDSESVFYFAGHGVQINGSNFLLAADATLQDQSGLQQSSLSLQSIMESWAKKSPKFSIAIIDACRDNPFPQIQTRSARRFITRGLVPSSAGSGQIILYSAASGQTALDNLGPGDDDPNGVFTRALLRHLPVPALSVDQVLRRTRQDVITMSKLAGHEQVPALYDESTGDYFFNPTTENASSTQTD
jgi:hypothetical protein